MTILTPFVPYHNSAGQTEIKKSVSYRVTSNGFGGLLTTEFLPPLPGRSFRLRQTYRRNIEGPIPENLRRLIDSPSRPKGPPTHFHQFQTEYFTVEHGICAVEIDGVVKKLTAEDGETSVKAGHIHAFWIDDATPDYMTVILSASDSGMDYQLDRVFFENWYGYWTDALLHDGGLDWIQTLCVGPSVGTKDTHDAGDHYTPAPAWMPFRRFFGYWTCVIVGRWIGGLLGYKPFFKEYTTDWDYAVAKMNGQPFIRRLIHSSYTAKTSWRKQVELSSGPKPTNAEFEEWVVDLAELASGGNKIATAGMNIGNAPINTNGAYIADGVAGANGYATGSQVSGDIARRKHHS